MPCKVERLTTAPVMRFDPSIGATLVVGWADKKGPCGNRCKGDVCGSCARGEEGEHDRLTAKGRRKVERWNSRK